MNHNVYERAGSNVPSNHQNLPFSWTGLAVQPSGEGLSLHNEGALAGPTAVQLETHESFFAEEIDSPQNRAHISPSSHGWDPNTHSTPTLEIHSHQAVWAPTIQVTPPAFEPAFSEDLFLSLFTQPSPRPINIQPTLLEKPREQGQHMEATHNDINIEIAFPLPTRDHLNLRRTLTAILASPWKIQNAFEPRHSTLMDFLRCDIDTKRWSCCFWVDGTPCNCSFSKKDQAKNHIRFHINHQPFSCQGRGICPKDGLTCRRRFCSAEALQKHRGVKKECPACGRLMLKTNLPRHTATACPYKRSDSQGALHHHA
ncbi:hypothetical protein M408DRAFT_21202 [Serendipita vermifera MAFF 305830]|uniref:C2H2-type domain-containing protein n=1 Tax=Serendipita vermifera MAFF 305830 TaxID=933852 RepID=A0A0C2X198_SERVB|nr:hypothetical protein M408DRAFT_21202 [Serendipita vermifera MAFF 305830]